MKAALVIEGEVFADARFRVAAVDIAPQVDVLVFQRAPAIGRRLQHQRKTELRLKVLNISDFLEDRFAEWLTPLRSRSGLCNLRA